MRKRESLLVRAILVLVAADSLPAPDILAEKIADDLEAALEQFSKIPARLRKSDR